MLLSNEELKEKVNAGQERMLVRWLNEHRIPWMKDRQGRAITTLSAIEKVLFEETSEEVDFT